MRGLRHGWLDPDLVDKARDGVTRAWVGLAGKVEEDGTIRDIIGGTGIQNTEADYIPDNNMEYSHASPGVGAVLIAIAEMIIYQMDML